MKEIQWFPGHMTKTRREMEKALPLTDFTLEVLDARAPLSSKNPDLGKLTQNKPSVVLLNKADLADERVTRAFAERFCEKTPVLICNCKSGAGLEGLQDTVTTLMRETLEKHRRKGVRRPLRAMVFGVPNVGKSALINRLCGKNKAKVENRPGVTRELSWTRTSLGFDLLDTPGVLWPKFDDRVIGENLAITGAIRSEVLSLEEIAYALYLRLSRWYPDALSERFGYEPEAGDDYLAVAEKIARRRGKLLSGGRADEDAVAKLILDEFRSGLLGRITLER